MIDLEITGVHFEVSDEIKKYVNKKIGKLDRYLPSNARGSAKGHVVLSEDDGKSKNRFTADATLTFPHGEVVAKEATISIYAAVDIVEEKLKVQILKHKSKVTDKSQKRKMARKLKGFNPFGEKL